MIMKGVLVTLIVLTLCPLYSDGHGRMMDPPARNSMWRLGFNNPINYNDNELYCGGRMVQWIRNKGKCGICGDAYHGKRDHEAGGKFANGIIGRSYHEGDIIPIVVHLTANHQGWFEFKLCPVSSVKEKVTQKCLDSNVLQRADGKGTTFPIPQGKYNAFFNFSVKLPEGLTCKQCVMQWKYRTGNTWDKDDKSGVFCLGCGPQEEFYNCADVEILPKGKKSHWIKATVPSTSSAKTETITIAPKMNQPKGNRQHLKKAYTTTPKPSKNIPHKSKVSVKNVTTPKPTKTVSFKDKLRSKYNSKKDKTSSQTYLIEPKIESVEKPWKAASTSKKLTKWLKKTTKASPVKPKSGFNKPKKTKLPSWLVNTRKIKERRRKLIARRQELLRRQQALRRQKNGRRYRPRTTTSTPTTVKPTTTTKTTTTKPTTTSISSTKPPNRILFNKESKQTPPCITEHDESPSMVASTDIPDTPAIVLREGRQHYTNVPSKVSYESISPQEIEKARGMSGDMTFENPEAESKSQNGYVVEYPEHPVVESENPSHPQVHRHRLPFQSKSPFANPSSPHANPLISYWWNQYQRPILSLWNNVRPILKCHATITLGGGMDEWCTANCNANFCPGGMCVCQPETSVYPTYSVYPPQSQGWMNSFDPSLRVDTPKPRKNPYIMLRQQRRQHDSYRRENIKQQQLPPTYTARNTVRRNVVLEEPSHHIKRLFAPTLRENTDTDIMTSDKISESTGQKVHKRSTSSTTSTTELPITTPIKTTSPLPPTTISPTTPKTSTQITTTTSLPIPTTRKSPVRDQNARNIKLNRLSFKAANRSYRLPKRTSLTWVINTQKSTRAMDPKTTTKQTTLPDRTYKASPSSQNAISKTQSRRNRLRSKAHFWRRKNNYNCHAIGRYAGLKRFDNWCSQNCMQTICPLLICQCEVVQ